MEALFLANLKSRYKALKLSNVSCVPVPTYIESHIAPHLSTNIRIGVLNVNHLISQKYENVKDLIINYDDYSLS